MVSEPGYDPRTCGLWYQSQAFIALTFFLAVLSLLVLLHSQHRFRHHNSRHSLSPLNLQRLPVVILEFRTCSRCHWGVLHCTDYCTYRHRHWYCSNYIYRGITKIVFNRSTRQWKPRSHRSLHAPSHTTQRFCISISRAPRADEILHAPPRAEYFLHAPDLHQLTSALGDVITATSPADIIDHICWRHPPHQLTSSLTLTRVDFDHWLFPIVDFCNPGAPYPVFRIDFIFAVYFCIFCF